MKKILISLSLLLATLHSVKAQDVQVLDAPPDWTFMMSNLNTTQITSGVLYNKVAMFSSLYDYNRGKHNLSHADHFAQAINELFYATDQTKFMSAKQLKTSIAKATASSRLDVGIINTTLHQLNFNEKDPTTGGLTFANGKFVAIAGKPSFLSRKIFLASPLKEMVSGTAVSYNFSNTLMFNNATAAVKNLVVYFNDETPVTIINNAALVLPTKTVSYNTSGNKMIKFVATFTDNTTITTFGYHYFSYTTPLISEFGTDPAPIPCTDNLKDRGTYKSAIAFKGYDETVGYYGKFDYTIFYHTKNNASYQKTMLKPIIIIDGFDPGDTRKTTDCDCEQDKSEGGCFEKNSDVISKFPFAPIRTFNPAKHESIEDNMLYKDNEQPVNLIEKLRLEGYDVIILNIPRYKTSAVGSTVENKDIDGGADYVERNGLALASYIQNTKTILANNGSTEGLVIMGPSMGGLISRYALAYMEKKEAEATTPDQKATWKHNTRIWVSFDSPHLGANIPMGAQANIWFFGNKLRNTKAEEKFNTQLNSTAGKQMLISQFQHTLNTMSNGTGYSNNSPFFSQFQSNLTNNGVAGSGGFPVSNSSFRKIAIVNGSLNGTKNGTESGEFLNIRGYKDPSIFEGFITGGVVGGILGATNANITLLRCRDKFYPAYGQTDDIFNGDGQNFSIGWSHWYINHKWYNLRGTNTDIRGSLDVVPAGTFTTGKILRDEIIDGLSQAGISNEVRGTNIDTHSFIPVFSALAHLQPNQSWSNPLNTNLACTTNKQTPFDSYFGLASNTGHIMLTKEMVDWLLKELAGEPQAPHFPIPENALSGENAICENQEKTYTFGNLCKLPSPVNNWTLSNNLQLVSQTPFSVVVKGTYSGPATITANFSNSDQKFTKEIWVGAPEFKEFTFDNSPHTLCIAPYANYSYSSQELNLYDRIKANFSGLTQAEILNNNNWQWKTSNNLILLSGSRDSRSICTMEAGQTSISVRVKNACGWSEWTEFPFEITQLFNNWSRQSQPQKIFTIYPNPSNDIVSLELRDPKNQPDKNATITGELFDMMGLLKSRVQIANNKATFSVKGLNKGIYVLKIYINNQLESHQIAVE